MKDSSLRLFANAPSEPAAASRTQLEPRGVATRRPALLSIAPSTEPVATETPTVACVALEGAIIVALDAPADLNELASDAFRRKEYAVGELFAALSIVDAHLLHRRLSTKHPADPIATRFSRLVAERQARLLTFLGDARRRAMLARAR